MSKKNDLRRLADAAERIADALETLVLESQQPPAPVVLDARPALVETGDTVVCSRGTCPSKLQIVGEPFRQLHFAGWKRNVNGEWCCPEHEPPMLDPNALLARPSAAQGSALYHAVRTPISGTFAGNACRATVAVGHVVPAREVKPEERCGHSACRYVFRLADTQIN